VNAGLLTVAYTPQLVRLSPVKYTVSKKGYHPTTNDNFNKSCRIPVISGTAIAE